MKKPNLYFARILKHAFLALTLGYSVVVHAESSAQLLQDANDYLASGENRSAVIQLKNLLRQDPDNSEARLLLGRTYLELGDGASAEKELSKARRLGAVREQWLGPLGQANLARGRYRQVLDDIQESDSDSQDLRIAVKVLRGRAYLGLQDLESARDHFKQVLALKPGHPEALLGMSRHALLSQDYEAALDFVARAQEGNPDSFEAWLLRGEVESVRFRFEASVEAFTRALEMRPGSPIATLGRASANIGAENLEAAQKDVDQVRALNNKMVVADYLHAMLAFKRNDLDEAEETLRKVLKVVPDHPRSHLLLGSINYSRGRMVLASEHLERYVSEFPDDPAAIKMLAAARTKLGRTKRAIELLEKLYAKGEEDAQLLAMLGSAYMQVGDYSRGSELIQQAIVKAPEMASLHAQLALGYLATGSNEKAVQELETAIDLGQGLEQADMLLVMTHLRSGQMDKAVSAAERFVAREPQNPVAYNLLGTALVEWNQNAEARRQFQRAVELDDKFAPARLGLAAMALDASDLDGASRYFRAVLEKEPSSVPAMLGLASIAEKKGNAEEMLEWLQAAQEKVPDALQPAALLASYYIKVGENLKALGMARHLQSKHPGHPVTLKTMGIALAADGDLDSAIAQFQRFSEAVPDSAEPFFLLASTQMAGKQFVAAAGNLDEALKREPAHLGALVAKSQLALADDQVEAALELAQRIKGLHPKNGAGFRIEGDAMAMTGKWPAAVAAYEKGFAKSPGSSLALALHSARIKNGQLAAALAGLEEWLQRSPEDINVRMALALAYQTNNRQDESLVEYERIRQADPRNVVALNNLAWLYQEKGDERAVGVAEQASTIAPHNPDVTDTLGWVLVNNGRVNRGLVVLQQAVMQAPQSADIRFHLAVGLDRAGRRGEAVSELERVLAGDQDFSGRSEAEAMLARLKTSL